MSTTRVVLHHMIFKLSAGAERADGIDFTLQCGHINTYNNLTGYKIHT